MAKEQSFEYRGYHIDRIESPSKNWRIGNILTFWRIRELHEAGRSFSMFNSRPEAKRRVDTEIDGQQS